MKLKWLKDKLGEKFYPIAHATGVVVTENKTLDSKLTEIDKDIKDNGYGEVAGGKNLANFLKLEMKTSNGITFEYQSNGSIKVSGTVSKDDGVYTPLKLTKTRLSKGHWYTASVKSSNPKSIAKLFFTGKGSSTTIQASETADMYYYIQFFDGVEGKIPVGTVIDEVLYPQIEEGKVVTEYEPYFPSNKMLAEEKTDKKETTVNLFKPTLESTTVNGIVVTNNGDGTYTLNGTASDNTAISIQGIKVDKQKKYKLVGCPANGKYSTYHLVIVSLKTTNYSDYRYDYGEGTIVDNLQFEDYTINIDVVKGTPVNNLVFKPMLTTNLSATYDDFVPYTGDTGQLNKDVAELRSDVDGLGDELVTGRIQLLANFTSDYYRYIEPVAGKNQILVPPIIVNGTSTSFDSSGGDEVSGSNYSYAPRESVKMDILDVEVSSSLAQGGITVKFLDKRSDLSKLYNVTGTATSDIEIPLYSVNEPKSSYLYFTTNSVNKMAIDTFYIKISDSSGNETTLGTDGSKSLKTYLKKHNGKVTVYLVVKSGITVKQYVNVKCGYSSSDCIADFSPRKYSDTIDNVIDAILDLNNRLKVLENK